VAYLVLVFPQWSAGRPRQLITGQAPSREVGAQTLFQTGLEQLPEDARFLLLIGLLFLALSLSMLLAIASYHRIVDCGMDSESLARFPHCPPIHSMSCPTLFSSSTWRASRASRLRRSC
jgi:hypothetical protein